MSVISRDSRSTSSRMIASRRCCLTGSSILTAVSTALRSDDSGFLISCATSEAKLSIALIRSDSAWVISRNERDKSPISSPRWVKSGMSIRPPRPRARSAAAASRRIGRAIVPAR